MSESWAQRTEHELIAAAARRYPRRRRAPAVALGAALALFVAAAVVLVIGRSSPEPAVPAERPTGSTLEDARRVLAVFRRPKRAEDAIPMNFGRLPAAERTRARRAVRESRLVLRTSDFRVYLFVAPDRGAGYPEHIPWAGLCMVTASATGPGLAGGGCRGKLDRGFVTGASPPGQVAGGGLSREDTPLFVFPDGVDHVTYLLADGRRVRGAVKNNITARGFRTRIRRIEWTDLNGRRRTQKLTPALGVRRKDVVPQLAGGRSARRP